MIGGVMAGWSSVVGIEIAHDYCEIAERRLIANGFFINFQ
jgi:hypothetical protein